LTALRNNRALQVEQLNLEASQPLCEEAQAAEFPRPDLELMLLIRRRCFSNVGNEARRAAALQQQTGTGTGLQTGLELGCKPTGTGLQTGTEGGCKPGLKVGCKPGLKVGCKPGTELGCKWTGTGLQTGTGTGLQTGTKVGCKPGLELGRQPELA